ncbi:kinase-like protein [Trichoderma citrinoviride]|uniref:Kinase-like protein n=1 Tax=Trichoderma citrinoviride TaxID=58853 RepID=A0A2T4B4Y1_9HYPO|nr:kinase-like protein [Trichoderma citrinoviride]PTB64384.1 kinase-like protein [Trichoderma citrinoviride]
MVSRGTGSTQESRSITRVPNQQYIEEQGSTATVELGAFVHVPIQQAIEDADSTREKTPMTHIVNRQGLQGPQTTQYTNSSTHAPETQAIEDEESTQEFTVPPHAPRFQDALREVIASASTDIPDRQVIGDDETTQEFTASTITHVPNGPAIEGQEAAQKLTASASTDVPDRQALDCDETTQEFTASTIIQIPDQQAFGDEERTEEHTAPNATQVAERPAIEHEETAQGHIASERNTDDSKSDHESTASSSTHNSGRHAAETQETAQEVPISTSFAANLPDRQVVEADALTPVPPFTITPLPSTALTHATGTHAMEARQEDSQPCRAGPASYAASIHEVAATSSSSEVRTEARNTEIPKKDDEQRPEISKEIISASTTVPSARLTIAYNRRFIANDKDLSKDVVRHPRTATGWDLISVVQSAKHADFMINLSYHNRPVEEAVRRFIPYSLSLQLIFQPASDNCVLSNRGGAKFYLEHLEAACACTRNTIDSMQCHVLLPGMWRILTRSEKPHEDEEYSLVQWLILPRKFTASADGESTKRQKLSETRRVRKHQDTAILIRDLGDGQSMRIRRVPGDTADYELQRIKHIASTASAYVFACRHSKVAGPLAVKVIDYDTESVNRFNRRAAAHLTALVAAWNRELTFLQTFNHNHIVSLKAFDGRLLALYMEKLPPSLDRGSTTKLDSSSVRAILYDISSALVYLERKGIVHHDIKPHNIAHSPARGAVLLDFGQAAAAKSYEPHGGTPAFLPPEFFDHGDRGHAGDVWAFGVTMLYVLGKTPMPSLRLDIPLRDLYKFGRPPQVGTLMKSFGLLREGLNQEDEIEKLVFRMLEPKPATRATAKAIVSALENSK